jgi:germination protein M
LNRVRRIAALFLAFVLLAAVLVGCAGDGINAPKETVLPVLPSASLPTIGARSVQTTALPLYFRSSVEDKLTTEVRHVVITDNKNWAQAALEELVKGPEVEGVLPVLPAGTEILSVDISRNLVMVDLSDVVLKMEEQDRLIARVAIASTVYEAVGIENVKIFVEGMEQGYLNQPVGILDYRKYAEDINALFLNMEYVANLESTSVVQEVVLYFADKRGEYMMPEVRTISMPMEDPVGTIMEELGKGSTDTVNLVSALPRDMQLLTEPVVMVDSLGKKTLELNFSKHPEYVGGSKDLDRSTALAYATIVHTFCSYMTNMDTVVIKQNGQPVTKIGALETAEDGAFKKEAMAEYLGTSVPLYFSSLSYGAFARVSRTMLQEKAYDPLERIYELMRGPLSSEGDDEVLPVFPSGIAQADIRSIVLQDDMVFVDVSRNFAEVCGSMDRRSEWMMLYAIVNTLSDLQKVRSVQFFVEGQIKEYMSADGTDDGSRLRVCIAGPLMRNSGIQAN